MSTASAPQTSASAASRTASAVNGVPVHSHNDPSYTNGHSHQHHHHHEPPQQQPALTGVSKKGKNRKAADPNEASKLIAAKISQLESDAAGEKDQEVEIGALKI